MSGSVIITKAPAPSSDRLLAAIFIALIVHVGIILGITFSPPVPKKINKSISITLVNSPTRKAPDKAEFLAQENQIGAGNKKQKAVPPTQRLPRHGNAQQQKRAANQRASEQPKSAKKVITQLQSDTQLNAAKKTTPSLQENKKRAPLSADMLKRQIAEMGVEVRHKQLNAEYSRIKFIDSVNAHKYKAAYYIKQWQSKVERVGNLNYPAIARKQNFSGKLLMDVGINHDGSIYSIRIRQSSGYKSLDDAAANIVRIGAPYAPLPKELRDELDVLVISRVWQFSDETGMSAH